MTPFIWNIYNSQIYRGKNRWKVTREYKEEEWGIIASIRLVFKEKEMFWRCIVVRVEQYCECNWHHWIVQLKVVKMANVMFHIFLPNLKNL